MAPTGVLKKRGPLFVKKHMPVDAISRYGPCAYRFIDYPMPGSIYTMPDIPSLFRGPTIVRLDNGHDMEVPANFKQDVKSKAQTHDMEDGDSLLKQLSAMLSGKKVPEGPSAMKGFELGRGANFMPMPGREQNMPRVAAIPGGGVHGGF